MSSGSLVKLERQGPVAVVTMDNPATLNAVDHQLGPELARTLEDLARDQETRAVVLTGGSGSYSAGANIRYAYDFLTSHPDRGASQVIEGYTKWAHRIVVALTSMDQPVISAVRGVASGAGLAWMLASDLVVAAEDAKLLPGFLAIGLVPAAGVTLAFGRAAGLQRAAEILMLGQPLSPAKALALGIVNRVVPAEQVMPQALALASELAQGPRLALAATKRLLNQTGRQGLYTQVENERRAAMAAADAPDFRERVNRFINRNKHAAGKK